MKKIINIVKERRSQLRAQAQNICDIAKKEKRELTAEEAEEIAEIKQEIAELQEELKSLREDPSGNTETCAEEENPEEETNAEDEESGNTENTEEVPSEEEETPSEETPAEEEEVPSEDNDNDNEEEIETNHRSMNKKNISILGAIKAVAEGRSFDAATAQLINETKKEMRAGGMNPTAAIVLPLEARALTVTDEEGDLAHVEWQSIMQPLFAKMILGEIGATQISANSEIKLPILSKANAQWVNEVGASGGTSPAATSATFKPHRLTCTVPLSNALLSVDGNLGVENAVLENILGAMAEKLQDSIFSTATGVTNQQPAGIFSGLTASAVADFEDVTGLEANLEEANVSDIKYVLSAKSKAAFRSMIKGTNGTDMVFSHGEMDGAKAVATSSISGETFAAADWKYLYSVVFNGMEIVVDRLTRAPFGETLLTVAMFADYKFVKPDALVYGTTAQ